jgi:hypothetical protein
VLPEGVPEGQMESGGEEEEEEEEHRRNMGRWEEEVY